MIKHLLTKILRIMKKQDIMFNFIFKFFARKALFEFITSPTFWKNFLSKFGKKIPTQQIAAASEVLEASAKISGSLVTIIRNIIILIINPILTLILKFLRISTKISYIVVIIAIIFFMFWVYNNNLKISVSFFEDGLKIFYPNLMLSSATLNSLNLLIVCVCLVIILIFISNIWRSPSDTTNDQNDIVDKSQKKMGFVFTNMPSETTLFGKLFGITYLAIVLSILVYIGIFLFIALPKFIEKYGAFKSDALQVNPVYSLETKRRWLDDIVETMRMSNVKEQTILNLKQHINLNLVTTQEQLLLNIQSFIIRETELLSQYINRPLHIKIWDFFVLHPYISIFVTGALTLTIGTLIYKLNDLSVTQIKQQHQLNYLHRAHPELQTIVEGIYFRLKWNEGWMHNTDARIHLLHNMERNTALALVKLAQDKDFDDELKVIMEDHEKMLPAHRNSALYLEQQIEINSLKAMQDLGKELLNNKEFWKEGHFVFKEILDPELVAKANNAAGIPQPQAPQVPQVPQVPQAPFYDRWADTILKFFNL